MRSAPKIAAAPKSLFRVVENGDFLNRLRNVHLEKSAVIGTTEVSYSPLTAVFLFNRVKRLRFQNLGKPRTAGLCGRAAGACDCGPLSVLKSNGLHLSKNFPVKFGFSSKTISANIAKKLPSQRCFKPLLIPFFNFSHKWPTFAFTPESGYTLGFRRKIAHKRLHAETGAFRTGPLSLPSDCFTRCGNPAWPGGRTANFAAFGSWSEVLPKNAGSLGTAMRLCVSLLRGAAAPLGRAALFAIW